MIISLIVALDEQGGIGLRQTLPWHLPSDLKRFKALTMGHHLIVGRRTYETIGKPLKGRRMVVITRQKDYQAEGCFVVHSFNLAVELARESGETEAFVGGGGEIFAQAHKLADRIYLTRVHTVTDADTFFPPWIGSEWRVVHQEVSTQAEELPYTFQVLERIGISDIDKSE